MQPTKLKETQNQPSYHWSTPNRKLISHHCSSIANTTINESQRNFRNPPKETHLQLDPKQICTSPYSTTSLPPPKNPNEPKLPNLGHWWWRREVRENRDKDRERLSFLRRESDYFLGNILVRVRVVFLSNCLLVLSLLKHRNVGAFLN